MKYRLRFSVFVCLVMSFLVYITGCSVKNPPVSISSQQIVSTDGSGIIEGRVTDDKGSPLPGVSVTLESSDKKLRKSAATSSNGQYIFRNIPSGEYSCEFSIEGFTEVRQEDIKLVPSSRVSLLVTLKPSLAEEFTVVGETPMIDTRRSGNVEIIRPRDYHWDGSRKKKAKKAQIAAVSVPETLAQDAEQLLIVEQTETTVDFNEPVENHSEPLMQAKRDGKLADNFPLKRTDVEAEISGFIAQTSVVQIYSNPHKESVEAVYVFPLPTRGAVYDFVMEIEGRRTIGIVRPREEAQRIYEEAKEQGFTASLLTQERPNIFTQNVANIPPEGIVTVRISYFERLRQENGYYEYVFPAVVGERYTPAHRETKIQSSSSIQQGAARGADPEIQVPVTDSLGGTGHFFALTVRLNSGLPIKDLKSAAHKIEVQEESPERRIIRVAEEIPNRDFILRWKIASDQNRSAVLTHATNQEGYFALLLQSPPKPDVAQIVPREITFILDISGSMEGLPLEVSREVIRRSMDHMQPADLFNIIYFSGGNQQLWENPQPANHENLDTARDFLKDLQGGGGTEMLPAIRRAVSANHDLRYLQMYVFLTDGFVGNEAEILRVIKEEKGQSRFFAFGIGSSVNRYLIEGIGKVGDGLSCVVLPREQKHAEKAASWFFQAINAPVLIDIQIDWQGLPVERTYPRKPRDLFAGQAIEIIGKYHEAATGNVVISGRAGLEMVSYTIPAEFPSDANANHSLPLLYAQQRIEEMSGSASTAPNDEKRQKIITEITDLSMKTGLVSAFTSFVAVDESRVVSDGRPIRIFQPVEKAEGSFGGSARKPVRVDSWGLQLRIKKEGEIQVSAIDETGTAAQSGVHNGARIKRINGTSVYDLGQLEGLLLQANGKVVEVELEPGGTVILPLP